MIRELRTVALEERSTAFADFGAPSNHVLILLHAFPVGVEMWEPQRDAFAGWRVIAPVLPGFDGTDLVATPSIDSYARRVVALMDHLEVDRAVVGGLSLGGYVTFGLLRRAPERVTGVILADTRAGADSEEAKAGRLRMLDLLARDGAAGVAADMTPKLLGKTTLAERPAVEAAVRHMIERQTSGAISGTVRALMERPDSEQLLGGIATPALIVVGEEDTLTPPSEAERMHAAVPASALTRIPAAGHLSNFENPPAFNAAVREFLARF